MFEVVHANRHVRYNFTSAGWHEAPSLITKKITEI